MEQEWEWLVRVLLALPAGERRSLIPSGYMRDPETLRAHVRALQTQSPEHYQDLVAKVRRLHRARAEVANTITGGTFQGPVIQAGTIDSVSTGDRHTGDRFDFGGATFNGPVTVKQEAQGDGPPPAEGRPVGDVEPWEFGVHATRPIPGLADVPPYVPRDCDEALWAELKNGGLVLILGERYAGKSYTAWQGVRSLKGHRLYAPDRGEDLRELPTELKGEPGTYVVWLDELTDHLGEGGLNLKLLGKLGGLGAVVLATMRPDEYYRRRARTAPADRVVARARTVLLPREWSEAELRRLAELDDPRAYPAYMWSGREGPASYFAIGHLLFDEWRREGTRSAHPLGQLLVRAAVELPRCGVQAAVPVELLRRVQEQYGTEGHESFEDAFEWATTPMFGASGMLVQGTDGTCRAYGALVAEALRAEDLEPVPDGVWWTLLDEAEAGAPIDREAVLDAARAALQPRFEAGDADLMFAFAGRVGGETHRELIRRAAEAGHEAAAEEWAAHLVSIGDETGALRHLEAAAECGSARAAREAGLLHRARSERWLRAAAEKGDGHAAYELGNMQSAVSSVEALRWYMTAIEAGYDRAAVRLGRELYNMGDKQAAESWFRYGVAQGDPLAMNDLAALLYIEDNNAEEAEQMLRAAMAAGQPDALRNLGRLLINTGSVDEGESMLRRATKRGDGQAAHWLGIHLKQKGRGRAAEQWLSRADELGHLDLHRSRMTVFLTEGTASADPAPGTVDE